MSIMRRLRQSLRRVRQALFLEYATSLENWKDKDREEATSIFNNYIARNEILEDADSNLLESAIESIRGTSIDSSVVDKLNCLSKYTNLDDVTILSKVKERPDLMFDDTISYADLVQEYCGLTNEQVINLEKLETKRVELKKQRSKELLQTSFKQHINEKDAEKYCDKMVEIKYEAFNKGYYSERRFNKEKDIKSKLFDEELKVLRSYVSQYGEAISFQYKDFVDSIGYMHSIFRSFSDLAKMGLKNEQLFDLIEANKDFLIEQETIMDMLNDIGFKGAGMIVYNGGVRKKKGKEMNSFANEGSNRDAYGHGIIAHCLNIEECQAKAFLDAYENDKAYRDNLQQQSQNEIKEAVEEMMQENLVAKQAKLIAEKMGARTNN